MRNDTYGERCDHRGDTGHEEKWNDRNERADRRRNRRRRGRSPWLAEMLLREAELALRHCLDQLLGLLGQALGHPLRFFLTESLKLVKKRHLFDFFLWIFFDLGFFAGDMRLLNFAFAFH